MKKKYYIIYRQITSPLSDVAEIFTLVESKKVADDWCKRNNTYFYIERECE